MKETYPLPKEFKEIKNYRELAKLIGENHNKVWRQCTGVHKLSRELHDKILSSGHLERYEPKEKRILKEIEKIEKEILPLLTDSVKNNLKNYLNRIKKTCY